jgi:hypothetical protein
MEENLNCFVKMGENLNIMANWKTTSHFQIGRRPYIFEIGRRHQSFEIGGRHQSFEIGRLHHIFLIGR